MMQWDVVNRVTDDGINLYNEIWRRGVFSAAIKAAAAVKRAWPLLVNHQASHLPIGATLAVHERSDGPWFTGKISKTAQGDDIIELIQDGALPGVSVRAPIYRSRRTSEGVERLEAGIMEISLTPFPQLIGGEVLAMRSHEVMADPRDRLRSLQTFTSSVKRPW